MGRSQSVSRIDKFLGINESDDSGTELKLGEASKMVNWRITDGANIETRPGFERANIRDIPVAGMENAVITGMWTGYLTENRYMVLLFGGLGQADYDSLIAVYTPQEGSDFQCVSYQTVSAVTTGHPNNIFYFSGMLYAFLGDTLVVSLDIDSETGQLVVSDGHIYCPVTVTGAAPAGGGTALEQLNSLHRDFRMKYSSDGQSAAYVLSPAAVSVKSVLVDTTLYDNPSAIGSYNAQTHTFTFASGHIPPEGINNVVFTCSQEEAQFQKNREKFFRMPYCEAYNGSTDSRLFFYGDGTNTACYTGVPADGTGLYIPAMNEVAVDFSDSPITSMVRHYSKLMVFKPDGAATITYEPVTLEGGDVIAGFYLRNASREIGNEAPGQVQTVNNYPRTLFKNDVYEWRVTSSYYQDERYAKRISDRIRKTISSGDISKMVTCDDNLTNTYYIFLNDGTGRILVNNYHLDVWSIYQSELAKDVKYLKVFAGHLLFATESDLFYATNSNSYDAPVTAGGEKLPIEAVWESGYMHFGADYLRKYSSDIWVSALPQASSAMVITAATDRRDEYAQKRVGNNILDWSNIDFGHFSFSTSRAPKLRRVKLKVKKFVYYKLIFLVNEPGARAAVLSIDQTVRYAGYAK